MRRIRELSIQLLIWLTLITTRTIRTTSASKTDDDHHPCSLYLAPTSTTTSDEPKRLGMYAGIDYEPSTPILHHPNSGGEIAIPILDLHLHHLKDISGEYDDAFQLLAELIWTSDTVGASFESTSPDDVFVAIPGIGMLGNRHPGLINADWEHSSCLKRSLLDSTKTKTIKAPRNQQHHKHHKNQEGKEEDYQMVIDHPGRGAYSEYYNATIIATQYIPAGMELFVNFGESFEIEPDVASPQDYIKANEAISMINQFMDKYQNDLTPAIQKDLYDFLIHDVIDMSVEETTKVDAIRTLFPKDAMKLQYVHDLTMKTFQYANPNAFRTMDWLQTNAQCLDGLYVDVSTLEYAGRGAFASRSFQEGDVLIPVPLLHLPNGDQVMDLYDLEQDTIEQEEEGSDGGAAGADQQFLNTMRRRLDPDNHDQELGPIGKQLMLNYCLGHPQSSLLLYPYGSNFNFINHPNTEHRHEHHHDHHHDHQPRANVKLQWSQKTQATLHDSSWLHMSPNQFLEQEQYFMTRTGLAMELVALRDIDIGEEIFLDYGLDWDIAWNNHITEWNKHHHDNKEEKEEILVMPTALELNQIYSGKPFPTPEEMIHNYYPWYNNNKNNNNNNNNIVRTGCHIIYIELEEDRYDELQKEIQYTWTDEDSRVWEGQDLRPCDIIERFEVSNNNNNKNNNNKQQQQTKSYNYTVWEHEPNGKKTKVYNVPHEAVKYIDFPYTTPMHMNSNNNDNDDDDEKTKKKKQSRNRMQPFRHFIGIPDELLPDAWRDIQQQDDNDDDDDDHYYYEEEEEEVDDDEEEEYDEEED